MRRLACLVICLLGLPWLLPLCAQLVTVEVKNAPPKDQLRLHDLQSVKLFIPGVGAQVPGLPVDKSFPVRHWIGPASHGADRVAADSTWSLLDATRDSVRLGYGLHWIRFPVTPSPEFRGVPMLLAVTGKANYEIYLNGRFLMRSGGTDALRPLASDTSGQQYNFVPFSFACDGMPETVAVRIAAKHDASFNDTGFRMSLHRGDLFYGQQRLTTHYGIFIGINLVVVLFSLVMWWSERRERTWLFLALISVLEVVGMYAELGTGLMVYGLDATLERAWRVVALFILPWQLYFLVRVLGLLRGHEPPRRRRWAFRGAWLSSLVLGCLGLISTHRFKAAVADMEGMHLVAWGLLAAGVVLMALVIAWLFVLVLRLGFGLMRTKGYASWVGAGVVVSFLLAVALRIAAGLLEGGLSEWMGVVGMYANHAAVPLFTGVYLSIRSAHMNTLVKRQRDGLDAEVKARTAELRAEKERSEELLLNILPGEVAQELKEKGQADARLMEQVTVLFTDFKGFTAMSEKIGPRELVADINECFSAFDRIMEKHGVEKIKTIGDAYMAAGGLPVPSATHARDVLRAALEVQEFIAVLKERKLAAGKPFFEVRIGVHSGPVVAGIVGVKKFQYDIWGDTVNTASRMESSGEVGQVNISGATYALVKDDPAFLFTPRGVVEAKGKGGLEMYFVHRGRHAV
ncbi:MAG: hypothetical protein J5I62_11200 [Flavobacteriales bacterium]|nr:hypothetical protein [Flavobacteriales bacterium]MEB2342096.1 hypothetical protein [Flavobacteriia bacterium]